MKIVLKESPNKLIRIDVFYNDNCWVLNPKQYLDGSRSIEKDYIFKGDIDEFTKFLMSIRAKDTASMPASYRSKTYRQMAQDIVDRVDTEIWVWRRHWKFNTNIIRGKQ